MTGPCWEFADEDYPSPGFVFTLLGISGAEIDAFLSDAYTLISYLQANDIAHNVYVTRGSSKCQSGHFDSIRLFVWARTPSYGEFRIYS